MPQTPSFGRIVIAGLVGGVLGGALSLALWLIAGAIGMPTGVNVQGQGIVDLAWFQFIGLSTFAGAGAGVLAALLRKKENGLRIFVFVAIVVLVISMAGPLAQPGEVAWSTRIVLMVTHIVVYITVVKSIQREMSPADAHEA
jgi:predicted membrane channel-forming protein YqfA (hemolysin III family)